MPEEINRIVTDALADLLWTPSSDGNANLMREGVSEERVELVGNIMIDSLEMMRPVIERRRFFEEFGLTPGRYGVVTLHRPSNVDSDERLTELVRILEAAAARLPIVFPVHPRTRLRFDQCGLGEKLVQAPGVFMIPPAGYIDFMSMVFNAAYLLTDSGGVQEETTYLGIPCLTVRENTERPVTVTQGTNRLIKPCHIVAAVNEVCQGLWPKGCIPELWDGNTASRVVASLKKRAG